MISFVRKFYSIPIHFLAEFNNFDLFNPSLLSIILQIFLCVNKGCCIYRSKAKSSYSFLKLERYKLNFIFSIFCVSDIKFYY